MHSRGRGAAGDELVRAGRVGTDWLFNPEQPELCGVAHATVFSELVGREWMPLRGFVTDFLGTRTPLALECSHTNVVPSRRLECEDYRRIEQQVGGRGGGGGGSGVEAGCMKLMECFAGVHEID